LSDKSALLHGIIAFAIAKARVIRLTPLALCMHSVAHCGHHHQQIA
jgi:hypothetical protein